MDNLKRLIDLHERASCDNIEVYYYPFYSFRSACVEIDNIASIGISATLPESEEMEALAHELSHCYHKIPNAHASWQERAICEARANRDAAEMLISWEDYRQALENPWNDCEAALAEYFNVSLNTLRWAIKGFQYRGLLNT